MTGGQGTNPQMNTHSRLLGFYQQIEHEDEAGPVGSPSEVIIMMGLSDRTPELHLHHISKGAVNRKISMTTEKKKHREKDEHN